MALDVTLRVALPLGISLYILQSLSYVIDVYRGHSTAMRHFGDFLCFEMMYPQVVAGPIIRYSEIEDQLHFRTSTPTKFARGVSFFALGLAKKVLIANPCGKVADLAFDAGSLGALDAWYGVTAYAFQIYFDFSGYSDMAIGLALMLGFVFPKTSTRPTCRSPSPSSGTGGTSRCRPGCAITCTSRSAATAKGASAPT